MGEDALLVNWCELTVSRPDGRVTYHNVTPLAEIVQAGRTRYTNLTGHDTVSSRDGSSCWADPVEGLKTRITTLN
jgi:hypothetical protein